MTSPAASAGIALCRLIAGGVFVFAAANKIADVRSFAESIMAFKVAPADNEALILQAAYAMPWIELLAGVALILGFWTRAAATVIAALLLVFIGMVVSVILRDIDAKCPCFGRFRLLCSGPLGWCKVIENSVLLAFALVPALTGGGRFSVDALRGEARRKAAA